MPTLIVCAACSASCEKETGHVNRMRRAGKPLYCSVGCSASVRKVHRSPDHRLTVDEARALFTYDPLSGELRWAQKRGGPISVGDLAGSIDGNGHRTVSCQGKTYPSTHIIWAIVHGRWPTAQIDHRNRQRSDDRLDNLREATTFQNASNRSFKTGTKGVSYHRGSGKFHARIVSKNRLHFLGSFDDEEAAARAYDAAAKELHGEFALTNEMMEAAL